MTDLKTNGSDKNAEKAEKAEEAELPFLSFNATITKPVDLALPVAADSKKKDPKLDSTWVLYEQPEQKSAGSMAVRPLLSVSTVKQFWSCWNHVPQPSHLLEGKKWSRIQKDGKKELIAGFAIFKEGVRPEWEDPQNAYGGHFEITLQPQIGGGCMDEVWNNVVLGMVGGLIEPSDMITGARLIDKLHLSGGPNSKLKPNVRLELWFNDYENEKKRFDLRGSFERLLRTRLDGSEGEVRWGYTQVKSHIKKGP
eukprot:TRINITY_DN106651_c0_g1_i1.p1 TRINITY_DN106651_c0_g1~~TRINITY_DN106651_c0_g1_i1.p1  ORF type:complete len:253 (-),score=47.96 TRINITY_DN106651_c0_g1_i1:79-837(-)